MGAFLKSGWIWLVVAVAVVAFLVFLRPNSGPEHQTNAENTVPDIVSAEQTPPVPAQTVEVANSQSPETENIAAEPSAEAALQLDAPVISSGLNTALQTPVVDADAGPNPLPDSPVSTASAPLPSQSPPQPENAPEVAGDLVQTPLLEEGSTITGAPAPEVPPVAGNSGAPLSLAQVLLPGEAPQPGQVAPSFDLIRVSPDGSAVIAGRAEPGANVQVFSGTVPVAEAIASARGEFVVFLNAPSATAEDIAIPAAPEGASLVVSQDDVVILPAAPDAADTNPVVVHRTPDAVQIVQPSGPAIPSNVSLDLVSYADTGAVQLAGRGQPGNVARVYADGQLAGETPIASGGNWQLEIADIAEGRYVLRVDELDASGAVTSRTESPFQREFPEANLPETFTQGAKIIVQPGNTLWLMATEAYGNGGAYTQIFSANQEAIRDPDLIYPGQIFAIPRTEE